MPKARRGPPLTVTDLRDELKVFMQDMTQETVKILKEHVDEHYMKRPKPLMPKSFQRESINQPAMLRKPSEAVSLYARTDEEEEEETENDASFRHLFKRNPCVVAARETVHGEKKPRSSRATSVASKKTVAISEPWASERASRTTAVSRPTMLMPGLDLTSPLTADEGGEDQTQERSTSRGSRELVMSARSERRGPDSVQVYHGLRSPSNDDASSECEVTSDRPSHMKLIVHSHIFERTVGVLVLLNGVMLGLETDYQWTSRLDASQGTDVDNHAYASFLQASQVIFCLAFLSEVVLRMMVDGMNFFAGQDWGWNLFDLVVIGLQVVEQITHVIFFLHSDAARQVNTGFLRTLSILRVTRITRLIRMVRLLEELRTIVASICSSMISLVWTFLLLLMVLYSSSLFFTEIVLQAGNTEHSDKLRYWYGGLGRTYLTMFECIFGGVSWDEVVDPLVTDISPMLGFVFCLYISFCVLAMMNMATGVFVDNAMRKAQEDKDTNTANHISDLFFKDPNFGRKEDISFEQFCSKIDTPEMQEYFRAINVDPSEAKDLYKLIDADESGAVDAEEMVSGILRLRGGAKALELSLLMHETVRMSQRNAMFMSKVERYIAWMSEWSGCAKPRFVSEEDQGSTRVSRWADPKDRAKTGFMFPSVTEKNFDDMKQSGT